MYPEARNITLRPAVASVDPRSGVPARRATLIDFETTGPDPDTCHPIEVATLSLALDEQGRVCALTQAPPMLQQAPEGTLSEEAARLTGLDEATLEGQRIDWAGLAASLENTDWIVAHHASFDRAVLERALAAAGLTPPARPWACSFTDVDWTRNDPGRCRKLQCLVREANAYIPARAHRAGDDVHALAFVLAQPANERENAWTELLETAARPTRFIAAVHAPYEARHELKLRGYRWQPNAAQPIAGTAKYWWTIIAEDAFGEEIEWLRTAVYPEWTRTCPHHMPISAQSRYLSPDTVIRRTRTMPQGAY